MSKVRRTDSQFAVCVKNKDYPASLEPRKIYRVIPDAEAAADDLLRIVDESGDDYLYPAEYFITVELPRPIQNALRLSS